MKDTIEIGPVPAEEDCEQLGPNYDPQKAREQCVRFIKAIRSVCGEEPEGARLFVKSNPHDFGTYYEVAVQYDTAFDDAVKYAIQVESNAPSSWPLDMKEPQPSKPAAQAPARYWMGSAPVACDLCEAPLSESFVDGKTNSRSWACMCMPCHSRKGVGLGVGFGQKYTVQLDGRWMKVAG